MAHRMGRARAAETYPESRRNTTLLFARNFARGPKQDQGLQSNTIGIQWSEIDSIVDSWDATVTYSIGDIVSFAGTTWVSTQNNNVGHNPTIDYLFWQPNTGVPITPRVTGVVVVAAVVTFENVTENVLGITVTTVVDGSPISELNLTIPPGIYAVPVLAEATGLTVGTTAIVEIELLAENDNEVFVVAGDATIEVREMQVATG